MKLIKCLISLLIFSALLILMPAFAHTLSVTKLDDTRQIVAVKQVKQVANSHIMAIYPQLMVAGSQRNAFNDTMKTTVAGLTARFLQETSTGQHPGSTFTTHYTLYRSTLNQHPVISVLLESESSINGYAHPSHPLFSLTYDLTQGKVLALSDVFKSGSNYLNAISQYTQQTLLNRKDADQIKDFINAGTQAKAANFKVWNLTDKGLLITFPEYAVAPYYYGKQAVVIPFSALKDLR